MTTPLHPAREIRDRALGHAVNLGYAVNLIDLGPAGVANALIDVAQVFAEYLENGRPPAVVDVTDSLGLFAAVDSDPMAKGEYWPAASEAFRHITEVFEPIRKAFGPRPFDDSVAVPIKESTPDQTPTYPPEFTPPKKRVMFWVCPDGHSTRARFDKDEPMITVEWRDGVAYCTESECGRSSATDPRQETPDAR